MSDLSAISFHPFRKYFVNFNGMGLLDQPIPLMSDVKQLKSADNSRDLHPRSVCCTGTGGAILRVLLKLVQKYSPCMWGLAFLESSFP